MATKDECVVLDVDEFSMSLNAGDLDGNDVFDCLLRHTANDWSQLDDINRKANERALKIGGPVISRCVDRHGSSFLIVTEADRSCLTVLLPEEY